MEEAKQGAADIEKRKEIEIRVMQIKILKHAQNNQTIAIPTKTACKAYKIFGRGIQAGEGKGRTKHLLTKRKELQDQRID